MADASPLVKALSSGDVNAAMPEAYMNPEVGPGAPIARMVQGLMTLPQRAIQNSQYSLDSGTYDPKVPLEAAMLPMGTGAIAGVPVRSGETVLGSGLVNKLPMDESARLARAKEQGFTVDAYKGGQPYDWRTMPSKDWKGNIIPGTEDLVPQELTSINSPDRPYAGFFSNDPKVADRFAEPFEHGAVWPVKLKLENPLVIDAKGKHAAAFQFDTIAQQNGTLEEMKKFQDAFRSDSPHDGVILKNTKDEGDVFIPRQPTQIRSRFARFDPNNINSGNLLGTLAGAGAFGALAQQGRNGS